MLSGEEEVELPRLRLRDLDLSSFPQESSPFRSNTLCDLYVVGMNSPWAVESFQLNKHKNDGIQNEDEVLVGTIFIRVQGERP
ncbi:hypothetical protein ACPJHQ_15755 [Rossellomorea sp. H39__3]